ncbi:MAG: hypothetical protein JW993_09220 [Sedimentisphaerales bacterium]|nr:hypothetical protein [Sedimentisphaerales bacterium]
MAERDRWCGLTVIEVCVVVALIVVFVALVLPALRKTRKKAFAMTCKKNLSNLGMPMLIYAGDNNDKFPVAAGPGGLWAARTPNWRSRDKLGAYGMTTVYDPGQATVAASLYLLVKYGEVIPQSFLCPDDGKARPFDPADYGASGRLVDFWDFGPEPVKHVSYGYHMPHGGHALTTSRWPGMAVAADRNPWMDSPSAKARDFTKFRPDMAPSGGTGRQGRTGNSFAHNAEGQNVLFLDRHVEFVRRPTCGIDDDNIYTSWDDSDKVRGRPPTLGSQPADPKDSLLVNDPSTPPR